MDADRFDYISFLTLHERGVSGKPIAYDKLMGSMQWKAAKNRYNAETGIEFTPEERVEEALFVVRQLWTEKQTDELKRRIGDDEPVFITMPSTTGQNMLPEVLGRILRHELGGTLLIGDNVARAIHTMAMKDVPAEHRPFVPRDYMLMDPDGLRQRVSGKPVVVVGDVFSSGASAKAFYDTLAECKIQVTTVAGLLGDSRLTVEPQMVLKLSKALKRADIDIKAKGIAAVLSRGQINTLIDVLNTRGKDEQGTIADRIQRVLDSRVARCLGQGFWRGTQAGLGHPAGDGDRDEKSGMGVSSKPGVATGGEHDPAGSGEVPDALNHQEIEKHTLKRLEEREAARRAKRDDRGLGSER